MTETAPVLLLDDVFSELDAHARGRAVRNLPAGQTLLTTAGALPDGIDPEHRLLVDGRPHHRGTRVTRRHAPREPVPLRRRARGGRSRARCARPDVVARVVGLWEELVGPAVAAHARVRSVHAGVCTVTVDAPVWATQLRYLEQGLVERARDRARARCRARP